jgi:hypothetical protein
LGEIKASELDEVGIVADDNDEHECEFPYDVEELGIVSGTPSKSDQQEHAAYLFDFLSELFGEEKLTISLDLLRNSLANSPNKGAEEEEALLAQLETVLGTEGLSHLDDLFFLLTSS